MRVGSNRALPPEKIASKNPALLGLKTEYAQSGTYIQKAKSCDIISGINISVLFSLAVMENFILILSVLL